MTTTRILRFGWLLLWTAGLDVTFGCGGRTDTLAIPDAGSGTGGASGSGGAAPHSGGRVGAGGLVGTGGRIGTGGLVGTAGSPGCGRCPAIVCGAGQELTTLPGQCCPTCVPCRCPPPVMCPLGTQSVTNPGECCPSCEPCGMVDCAIPDCGPGSMATTLPGQCCPVCVTSDPCAGVRCDKLACPPGTSLTRFPGKCCPSCTPIAVDASPGVCDQAGFAAYLEKQIIGFDGRSCMVDSDCTVLPTGGTCRSDCSTTLNTKSVMSIASALQQFASTYCTGCPTSPGTCGPRRPVCASGQCTSTPLPI